MLSISYLILRSARRARPAVRDAAAAAPHDEGTHGAHASSRHPSNSLAPPSKCRGDLGICGELSGLGLAQPFLDVLDLPAIQWFAQNVRLTDMSLWRSYLLTITVPHHREEESYTTPTAHYDNHHTPIAMVITVSGAPSLK